MRARDLNKHLSESFRMRERERDQGAGGKKAETENKNEGERGEECADAVLLV